MRGLDPRIHPVGERTSIENATGYRQEGMDPRVKPAGDADDRETLNRNQLENALEFV